MATGSEAMSGFKIFIFETDDQNSSTMAYSEIDEVD